MFCDVELGRTGFCGVEFARERGSDAWNWVGEVVLRGPVAYDRVVLIGFVA